jgi:hypothetical protein
MQPGMSPPSLPEARTCAICGVTREDVADVSYHGPNKERVVKALCADCKARHLVRKRKSRRQRISRGNRAAEVAGMVLVALGLVALVIIIIGAILTRLF